MSGGERNARGSEPTRRERLKPFEYVAFAAIAGLFTAGIVLLTIRDGVLAAIFGGIAFIVCLLSTATLMLVVKPRQPGGIAKAGEASEPPAPPDPA